MAAPTDVRIIATQASATSTINIGVCNAGDLVVLVATGTQTAIGTAGTVDEDGAVASGWTQDATVDGSGSARTRIWSKVLTAATSGAGPAVGPTGWTSNGTSRFAIFIHRHADGFDTTAANRLVGTATHNTNVANGSSVASISGGVRKLVAVSGVTYGSAQTALTVTWDGGSAQDPYVDESTTTSGGVHYGTGTGSCQADRKLYDTAETVDLTYSTGLNNTTHAIATVVYKTKPPAQTVAVGTATETDTGIALGHKKTRAAGTALETDTAFAITRSYAGVVGTALETDTAFAIGHTKSRAVGTAVETDTAFSISHGRILAVGTSDHSEAGLPVTWTKSSVLTVGLSTPSPAAYATKTLRAWAYTANATDVAEIQLVLLQGSTVVSTSAWLPITSTATAYTLSVGTITDYTTLRAQITARTTSSAVVRVSQIELELSSEIGIATETDTALPVGHSRALTVGVASEADTALAVGRVKTRAVGIAVETDTAFAVTSVQPRDITITPVAILTGWQTRPPLIGWRALNPRT